MRCGTMLEHMPHNQEVEGSNLARCCFFSSLTALSNVSLNSYPHVGTALLILLSLEMDTCQLVLKQT